MIGAALWFLAGLVYFAAYGRKRLVKAPEEEFALNKGHAAEDVGLLRPAIADAEA